MWTLLLLAVTVVSTRISVNPHMLVVLSDRRMDVVEDGRSNVEVAQSLLVRSRMTSNASITKALLCIAPKAGTTSILEWFIQLSAGESYKSCRSKLLKAKIKTRQQIGYLHDVKGPCWRPRQAIAATSRPEPYIVVVRANSLPPRERAELERELQQHDHKRLYTACVVRNPVDRLISAWKSKLACGGPHGEANAVKAKELFGTDVSDSKYLIPPLIKGAMVASPDLGKALKGKKCLQFTDAINLLEAFRRQKPNAKKREHYLMKSNMLGNEHLSLQTGLCRLPDGRQGGGSSNLLYADVIPVESLAEPSPEPLRRLANHLGVNLTEHPFLHVHASTERRDNSISSIRSSSSSSSNSSRSLPSNERATDAHTTDGVSTDEKILNLLNRIESVYREDVEALARLVQPEYPHSRAAAALKVAGILRHDDGTDSR